MLEQLGAYFEGSLAEQGINAGLEYADSFGPWGRTAAVGITLAATAGTTLLMMNKCRAKPAKPQAKSKASQTLTEELQAQSDLVSGAGSVETSGQNLQGEHVPSDDDSHQGPTTRLSSSSSSSSSDSDHEQEEHSDDHELTAEEIAAQERRNSLRSHSNRK